MYSSASTRMMSIVHTPPLLPPQFSIRQVSDKSELFFFLQQASLLQWNPCPLDLSNVFFDIDKDGFFVCVRTAIGEEGREGVEDDGQEEVVGCVSTVCYDADYAFVGYFIVLEQYQRRGIGAALFRTALAHAGDRRCVGLDGVVEQQSNYSKSGFEHCYDVLRFVGNGITNKSFYPGKDEENRNIKIVSISEVDFAEVAALDRKIHTCERKLLLLRLFAMPGAHARACVDSTGRVLAYGVFRTGVDRPRIGPLVSPNRVLAHALLEDLLLAGSVGPADEFSIDVPAICREGVSLAESISTTGYSTYQCARMYRPSTSASITSLNTNNSQVNMSFCFAQFSMEVG